MSTVFADLIANSTRIAKTSPRSGIQRAIYGELQDLIARGDFDYPASCAVGNETQSVAQHVAATGGTYTLTFTLHSGETFTTGNIAYDASAATVKTAIDSAATSASIAGWTNGDISTGGSALSAGAMTFTFDGDSVAGLNHGTITVNTALMTAAGTAGAASTTTPGDVGVDEVQSIAAHVAATGGTYVLTVLGNPTAAIAWNANAATIQTAVDLVSGVTAGHVAITGGPLSTTALTITFSGDDVDETDQAQTTIDGAGLTIAGSSGAVTPTNGQTSRAAWAALVVLGLINAPPAQGVVPTDFSGLITKANLPFNLSSDTIRVIIDEAAYGDDNSTAVRDALLAGLGL